jgi:hypothetical protein
MGAHLLIKLPGVPFWHTVVAERGAFLFGAQVAATAHELSDRGVYYP